MKIIIFDDDPTGSQTGYGCPLLLNWDEKNLEKVFKQPSQLIFILANTRSLSSALADKKIREICSSLKRVFIREGYSKDDYFYISRGDSTLRGHGVLEPATLAEELGPFHATFHIPAFFEGGRTTEDGIHYLNGIPVHMTDFGRDKLFGFSTSNQFYITICEYTSHTFTKLIIQYSAYPCNIPFLHFPTLHIIL